MPLKKFDIFSYSFIAMPIAFASVPIYIFLPEYYHSVFGIDLATLSIVLFSLRILDAIVDPIIGWYCDKFAHWSKISFILIIICFMIGVYITCAPVFSNKILNLITGIFLATLAFSYLTIFVATKGALWAKDEASKSTIISTREVFNIIGVLIASILPFTFIAFMPAQQSYLAYAIFANILILIAAIFFYRWLCSTTIINKKLDNLPNLNILSYIRAFNKDGVFLFCAYILSALGSAIPAVTLVFFSKHILGTTDLTGIYIFLYFLGTVIFIPVVKKIALKIGIVNTWGYSLIFCVIIFILTLFLSDGDSIYFSIICFLSGAGFACDLILLSILLAEWIDTPDRQKLGNGFYAIFAFIGKFCFALATILALPLINSYLSSPTELTIVIKTIYCVFPCIAKGSAAIILIIWFRKLTISTNS